MSTAVATDNAERTNDPIAALKQRRVQVMSGPAGRYPVAIDERELMCLLSTGELIVVNGQEQNMQVRSYVSRVHKMGLKVTAVRKTNVTLIRRLYRELDVKVGAGDVAVSASASTRQAEVIQIINEAVRRGASDIHIKVGKETATIEYRIHGDLIQVQEAASKNLEEICSAIYQSMCDIGDTTYRPREHQDARMSAEFVARCNLFGARISSGPLDDGNYMVLRLLYDTGMAVPTLQQLWYLPEQIRLIKHMLAQSSGINILSGVTGSGKSTTLVSVLTEIIDLARQGHDVNAQREGEIYTGISVITIEDPPEYKIHGARQTPLMADKADEESIRLGWANAIKACMRKDPDFMMIGEIRDVGSAKAAFDAAMTGHGVWSTLHVTDVTGIMMRLAGLGMERDRMLDPDIVTGLINQSLVQRLCTHCSVPWEKVRGSVDPDFRQRVERYCTTETVRVRGAGCPHCNGTGILGRMVVAEVIVPDLEFMEIFDKHGRAKAKDHWVRNMGGITKHMAMIRRINEGMVDPREAEAQVSTLDKEARTMKLDYSRHGSFAEGWARVQPVNPVVEPYPVDVSINPDASKVRMTLSLEKAWASPKTAPTGQVLHVDAANAADDLHQRAITA